MRKHLLSLILMFASTGSLCAQVVPSATGQNAASGANGGGAHASLSYSGEHLPSNLLLFDGGYESAYDDNLLGSRSERSSDFAQSIFVRALVTAEGKRSAVSVQYRPYYQFFRRYQDFNRLNQYLTSEAHYDLGSRWTVRARDEFAEDVAGNDNNFTGASQIATPTGLNDTLYVPASTQRLNAARLDLSYQAGSRTSFDVFAGHDIRVFSKQRIISPVLFDTTATSGGAEYSWRPTEHTSLGITGIWERIRVSGLAGEGMPTKMDSRSVLTSFTWHPLRPMELSAFAGPQIVKEGSFQGSLPGSAEAAQTSVMPAAGGSVVGRGEKTALELSSQHMLLDGGGLLSFVSSTSVEVALRRRLYREWDGTVGAEYMRNSSLHGIQPSTRITADTLYAEFGRSIGKFSLLRCAYEYIEQNSIGSAVQDMKFHRSRVVLGITWQMGAIRLGH